RAEHQPKQYVEKNALILAARASRAFHEYMPLRFTQAEPGRVYRKISYGPLLDIFMLDMRSYRGPNGEGTEESYGPAAYFLGPAQVAWLKRELINSPATWKVIAADMPIIPLVVYDTDRNWGVVAVVLGDAGHDRDPQGRRRPCAVVDRARAEAGLRARLSNAPARPHPPPARGRAPRDGRALRQARIPWSWGVRPPRDEDGTSGPSVTR